MDNIVYSDEYVTLYNCDSRDFIKKTSLNFDMVFADPPFDLPITYDYLNVIFGNCVGHAFLMHNERHLSSVINYMDKYFSRMYAVNTVVPNLISNKAPMQMADFIAEFRFSKTKFENQHECFSNLIEAKKLRMLKNYSGNFDKQQVLPATFIKHFTSKGDLIFDPFAGSCSTLIAAKKLGRRAIGCEKSKTVCKQAKRLLSQSVMIFD